MTLETLETHRCFGGTQGVYRHASAATGTAMAFSVFVPPQAAQGRVPVLWFLSGLTCTWENATTKAGFQRTAAEHGLMVVCPDTSPRGLNLPGEHDAYDFGSGAGFYLDATAAPWATNYRMETYVAEELPALLAAEFPADMARQGAAGHSMGGHGVLTLALKRPGRWRSVSAFAPIVAPSQVPWGQKAFAGYLGPDAEAWRAHDACALIAAGGRLPELLVDQGTDDPWLESQLKPELLEGACAAAGIPLTLRRQPGYDHNFYFVSTFMGDHVAWHAARLQG
ncbi:MAG: S-formylglutathione hydrolase [Geminicoccaceae bacterium]